jgi:hypothetical protein
VVTKLNIKGRKEEENNLGDQVLDGKVILRCVFRKWDVRV